MVDEIAELVSFIRRLHCSTIIILNTRTGLPALHHDHFGNEYLLAIPLQGEGERGRGGMHV